jgi:hypothetical protein
MKKLLDIVVLVLITNITNHSFAKKNIVDFIG